MINLYIPKRTLLNNNSVHSQNSDSSSVVANVQEGDLLRNSSKSFDKCLHQVHMQSQSGAVLIVSLVMLLLLMLIGTEGMQTTSLEEKMASNLRDKDLAFQAAESALSDVENHMEAFLHPASPNVPPVPDAAGTNGFYSEDSTIPTNSAVLLDSFWTTNPVTTSLVTNLGNGIVAPKYIIQKLPAACFAAACPPAATLTPYRITVRATGGSTNAVVILQSTFTQP